MIVITPQCGLKGRGSLRSEINQLYVCFELHSRLMRTPSSLHALHSCGPAPGTFFGLLLAAPASEALTDATKDETKRTTYQRHEQPGHSCAKAREEAPQERRGDVPKLQHEAHRPAPALEVVQLLHSTMSSG